MQILDIGCGSKPNGTVNMDLGLGRNEHHKFDYDVKKHPGFTRAALPELPYRDNAFKAVFCSHVLEHVHEPLRALKDIARVTQDIAILIVPNNPVFFEHPYHVYSWSKVSFENFCKLAFKNVEVKTQCRYFQVAENALFRRILKIAYVKKPFSRLISKLMQVEIVAICRNPY